MRILITADTVGGVWTYTRELVTGLTLRGVEVTLVSFGEIPDSQQTHWMQELPNLDFRATGFKLEWMRDSEPDLTASAEFLKNVIDETGPDLLHFNQFYFGALECDLPRVVVAHSDVVSWWVAVHGQEPPDSPWMRWYRRIVRRGIAGATLVVAPSRWMLEQISKYHAHPDSSLVIHNGRTPAIFDPLADKQELVVTVGRQWDQAKNAALLLRRPMPAPVCIVGSDTHPESQGRAFSGGVQSPTVRFESHQDELRLSRLLAGASIYAATSCYEPFGLAPLEAALSGCAIVASDIPTFRELWDGAALLFHNGDADSLADALRQFVQHRELRLSYGNLAYRRAQQIFTAERMVEDYVGAYRKLTAVGVEA